MEERKALNAAFAHELRTPLTVLKGYDELLGQR
ncbi:MAG: histidine kinase dimerization/phospho-acceptor domain-containing protein [Acutalibacteraceae bacterium]